MGLIANFHAFSARLLAVGTVLLGLGSLSAGGVLPAIILVIAGIFLFRFGGKPHQHGRLRRTIVGGIWMILLFVAFGMGV